MNECNVERADIHLIWAPLKARVRVVIIDCITRMLVACPEAIWAPEPTETKKPHLLKKAFRGATYPLKINLPSRACMVGARW